MKTHCLRGHERTPNNVRANGQCITCSRAQSSARVRTAEERRQENARARKERLENPEKLREYNEKAYMSQKLRPKHRMVATARNRAKGRNLPCTITVNDFEIPEFCPVLGVPLSTSTTRNGKSYASPNSPSLDRFYPALGYVPGNVAVISYRANALKGDGTLEDHRRLVSWMESWPAQRG